MSRFDRAFGALLLAAILIANMWYTHYSIEKSDRENRILNELSRERHCETLKVFIDRFTVFPPTDAGQEQIYRDNVALWNKNCKGK